MSKQSPEELSSLGSDSVIKKVKDRNTLFDFVFNLEGRVLLLGEDAQI